MLKKRVFVGLSGGVDSAVSAALLLAQGYDVTGVFIQGWYPEWLPCTWRDERRDAMRVAAHLGIPFLTCNAEKAYKEEVAEYMIKEYEAGRTPNPDVLCNREVKFGVFYQFAREHGADYIATGHYAQKDQKTNELLESPDALKDQSYFLWAIKQQVLDRVIFPIGNLEKTKVRDLAQQLQLPNAVKKDSQGICFLGRVSMKEFLSHYIASKKGDVLDVEGNIIGQHDGAVFYTIGERHGFSVRDTQKNGEQQRLYIIDKNIKNNTLTVGPRNVQNHLSTTTKELILESVVFRDSSQLEKYITTIEHGDIRVKKSITCGVRVRYHGERYAARVDWLTSGAIHVYFDTAIDGVATGQSAVIYCGDICVGGGIIVDKK